MKTKKLTVYPYSLITPLITLFTIHYSLFTNSVSAQISLPPAPSDSTITDPSGLPAQIISVLLPAILGILGFIAVYYMVLASIRLIISKGEPERVAEARSRLIYAVVGFIVLILSYAFLQVINYLFLTPGAT